MRKAKAANLPPGELQSTAVWGLLGLQDPGEGVLSLGVTAAAVQGKPAALLDTQWFYSNY